MSTARLDDVNAVISELETGQASNDATDPEPLFDWRAMRASRFRGVEPPVRRYLIEDFLPLDVSGILGAKGGAGKGFFALQLCVSRATGVPFLGMPVERVGMACFITAEDDEDELHRRIQAIEAHYREISPIFDSGALDERLIVLSRVGELNLLVKMLVTGDVEPTLLVDRLLLALEAVPKPVLLILDPLGHVYGGRLNWAEHATRFVQVLDRIRIEIKGCVLVPAHIAKFASRDGDSEQESVLGSVSFTNNTRWTATMQPLRKDRAKAYGVDPADAKHYVRLELPKANYVRPWPGMWLRREPSGVLVPAKLEAVPNGTARAKADELYEDVLGRLTEFFASHGPQPKERIREAAGRTGPFAVGKQIAVSVLHRGIRDGQLAEFPGLVTRGNGRQYSVTLFGTPEQQKTQQ